MNSTRNTTKKLALGGIVTALSFLALYAACVLPSGRVGFYFVTAFLPVVLLCEGYRSTAAISSLAVALLAFFILPDRVAVLPYVCFLAWYAVIRELLYKAPKLFAHVAVLVACDIGIAIWLGAVLLLFGLTPATVFGVEWPVWAWLAAGVALQAAILVANWFFGLCVAYYCNAVRARINGNRQR